MFSLYEICWVPAHVGIKGNVDTHRAAKATITMIISNICIPISDLFLS